MSLVMDVPPRAAPASPAVALWRRAAGADRTPARFWAPELDGRPLFDVVADSAGGGALR